MFQECTLGRKSDQGLENISGDSFSAIGTELKPRLQFSSAPRASLRWFGVKGGLWRPARFVEHPSAAVAFQKTIPPLDRNQGNKEKTQVMVEPFEPC